MSVLDSRLIALDASHAGIYYDVSHFLERGEPSPLPPANTGRSATKLDTTPAHLIFAIIATCSMPDRLRVADETFCSSAHHLGVACHAYVECDAIHLTNDSLVNVEVVPGSAYMRPWHAPLPKCCNSSIDFAEASTWTGDYGPSSFYCAGQGKGRYEKRVVATLPTQYRFLPALQHAKGAPFPRPTPASHTEKHASAAQPSPLNGHSPHPLPSTHHILSP